MEHIEQFINNSKINSKNGNLVRLQDLRLLKKVISEEDFINLIKNACFELKYYHLVSIKDRYIQEQRENEQDEKMKQDAYIANIIYENI